MSLFLLFVLIVLASCAVLRKWCNCVESSRKYTRARPQNHVYMALLLGYEVTYLQFVSATIKLFHCRSELASGEGPLVLAADTEITCFEGGHLWTMIIAVPLFILHSLVGARRLCFCLCCV